MPQSGMIALKSFQSFMINDGLLGKVVEAIKAGEKEARTSGDIQTFEVFYKGFRQNIAIGRVMVIPAKVADSRDTFPVALLYGTLLKEMSGEELADLITYKMGDTEFDDYSKADLAALKDKVFKNSEDKYESIVLFAPAWWNNREFIHFKFTKDDEKLTNMVRHLIFSAYFDPALSSAFNTLMTDVSTDKLDVTNITPKLNFPGVAENPLKDYPDMQKMGAGRKKIFLTKKTATAIEQSQIQPAELDVFEALNTVVERAMGVTPMKEVGSHKLGSDHPDDCDCPACNAAYGDATTRTPKQACGVLPVVQGTNVGPGGAEAMPTEAPSKGPEGTEPIGIELNADGTPKREEAGKAASSKTAGTISLANPVQVAIYKGELEGQMSDGAWENTNPMDHWRSMCDANVVVGTPGMDFMPRTTYGYNRLLSNPVVAERMLNMARAAVAYPSLDMSKFNWAIEYVIDHANKMNEPQQDWQQKYVTEILATTGEPDIASFVAKVNGTAYSARDLRRDINEIQRVVNTKFKSRYAAVIKQARDIDEHMNYKGHDLHLTTWQERDNFDIDLVDETTGQDLGHWSDNNRDEESGTGEASQMFEDGFFSMKHGLINSVVEYLESMGALTDLQPIQEEEEWNEGHGEHLDVPEGYTASSEKTRQAARKHVEKISKNEIRRMIAEQEVPTADAILNEALTDMGQAPAVDLPGQSSPEGADNRPTTTEAQVPAEMKSETPEDTKAESQPEQAATPFESKGARKQAKYVDVLDMLDSFGRFGIGSKMGASVAEDIAQAAGELDYDKSGIADNADVDQPTPNELFGKEAAILDDEEEWCEACQQHRPCSCDDMEADRAKEGAIAPNENMQCMDCGHEGPAGIHGGCEACGSQAISAAPANPVANPVVREKKFVTPPAKAMAQHAGSDDTDGTEDWNEKGRREEEQREKKEAGPMAQKLPGNPTADLPQELVEARQGLEQIKEVLETTFLDAETGTAPNIGPGAQELMTELDQIHARVEQLLTGISRRKYGKQHAAKLNAVVASLKKVIAGHEGERHDDVPVAQGKTENGKQPESDLSGAAPQAHDVAPQVDKKVASKKPGKLEIEFGPTSITL